MNPWEKYQAQQQPAADPAPWLKYQAATMPEAEPAKTDPERSFGSELVRQAGLAARYVGEGAAGLAGVVADPINATIDWATGRERTLPLGQAASELATNAGLPKPEGGVEELVGAASRGLVGTALSGGAGLAGNIPALSNNMAAQGVSAITGATAADLTRQAGGGTAAQLGAGLLGAMAPGAISATPGVIRNALRDGTADDVAARIADFEAAGVTPTAAQAAGKGGKTLQFMESAAAKIPGGAGRMTSFAEKQADDFGNSVRNYADNLSPNADATLGGQAIAKGITGEGGWLERFKKTAGNLYGELDKHVPQQTPVPVSQTRKLLDELSAPISGATDTSSILSNPTVMRLRDALANDAGASGALPFEAAAKLRSKIGSEIADAGLITDVPKAQMKRIYGALSDDINGALSSNPAATAARTRADNFWKSGLQKLDIVEGVVKQAGGPESIFNAAMSGTKEGGTKIRAVMSSLRPDERRVVTAAVVNRMAKANPGAQNAAGDASSIETYLTNWNKLHPRAQTALFSKSGSNFRNDMDKIARTAERVKETTRAYANNSNTARANAQIATVANTATTLGALFTGAVGGATAGATVLGVPLTGNLMARAMTNPTFVKWLAVNGRKPASNMAAQLGTLSEAARGDDDLSEVVDALRPIAGLSTTQAGGKSRDKPIAVRTPQEAKAYPSGTWVLLPDGTTEQVP